MTNDTLQLFSSVVLLLIIVLYLHYAVHNAFCVCVCVCVFELCSWETVMSVVQGGSNMTGTDCV